MSTRTRADAVRNKRLALDATKGLLAEKGAAITVEAISRRAGVGAATVVRVFGTKEALIDAAVADLLDPIVLRARAAADEPDPGRALRSFVVDLIAFQAAHLVVGEQLDALDLPAAAVRRAELRQAALDLVGRARAAGAIRTDLDPEVTTVLIGETAYAIARSQAGTPGLVEGFVAVLMDGLRN